MWSGLFLITARRLKCDRLLHFPSDLDARADTMDEPTVRLSPTAAALTAGGQLTAR
jgi:hypothetical protein